jgi:hypothetical protein
MKEICASNVKTLQFRIVGKPGDFLGINFRQYRILLHLFSTLSDRLEFMGMIAGLDKAVGFYLVGSLLLSMAVFANPSLPGYLLFMIGFSMFSILWILLMDAANSIMNPDEASVLAHQPIRGATYVAAKLTHILIVVGAVIPALNLIPAIAGLRLHGSRWFYPLTHLLAAYLAGLFIAFLICGLYGWMFRFISPANLKNAALWLQLITFLVMPAFQQLAILAGADKLRAAGTFLRSSWMPWRWFVAIGLTGHSGYPGFSAWKAGAACLMTCLFIALGLRAFRTDYMTKVADLMQGSASRANRRSRASWLSPMIRKIAGAPSGYGAFSFMSIMLRRDWNFRRQMIPVVVPFLVAPLAAVISSIRKSPFVSGNYAIRDFSLMHLFPHFLGMILAMACLLISYSAEPKGSAIFINLPIGRLRPFVRGIYSSLWMPVAILHLCLLGPCVWFWGIAHGVLYICFSVALVSVYASLAILLIDGLPFANAFKPSMAKALPLIYLAAAIPILFFAVIQWLVFYSALIVLVMAAAMALLAFVIAHFSLGRLEEKARINLTQLGFLPTELFKELE